MISGPQSSIATFSSHLGLTFSVMGGTKRKKGRIERGGESVVSA